MTGGDDPSGFHLKTTPFTPEDLDEIEALKAQKLHEKNFSLLIYHRDGIWVIPLQEGQDVIIGRCPPADITIRDTSLSRQHARVTLLKGTVWIEDLDSTNGTRIHGEKINSGQAQPGTEITFGGVMASVHTLAPAEREQFGLDSHDRFQVELEAEVCRSKTFTNRSLALLMIRGSRQAQIHVGRWFPKVRAHLRLFDRCAFYSSDTVEILVPECSMEQAIELAKKITSEDGNLRCGLGMFPSHARSSDELIEVTGRAIRHANPSAPVQTGASSTTTSSFSGTSDKAPIVVSDLMSEVFKTAGRVSSSPIPVLILGETGTGKEVVARYIHENGKRSGKPFICVNCGALPANLVESHLFGHEKGAFTGAHQQVPGVFEAANGGTVLLDEIGELPPPAQAALLRVIETKRFSRVGSSREIEVDVRVLAATHRDLAAMTRSGDFREDLLYRLDAMTITVPPLRDRPEEIKPLVNHFAAHASETNERSPLRINENAMELLQRYNWPGNVRELRNAMDRAVAIAQDPEIVAEDLPERVRDLNAPRDSSPQLTPTLPPQSFDGAEGLGLREQVDRFEAQLIMNALRKSNWDRKEAARLLDLPLSTLAHKMKSHSIKKVSYELVDEE